VLLSVHVELTEKRPRLSAAIRIGSRSVREFRKSPSPTELEAYPTGTSICVRSISGGLAFSKNNVSASDEVCPGIFDRRTLTGDVQFRAQRDKAVIFPFDDRGQALLSRHIRVYNTVPLIPPLALRQEVLYSSHVEATGER
jgi:hypothetical protein